MDQNLGFLLLSILPEPENIRFALPISTLYKKLEIYEFTD